MKRMNLLMLAALTALAAMAVVASPASASATVCTKDAALQDIAVCEGDHGNHLKIGSKISASLTTGTNAVLTVTNADGSTNRVVTCTASSVGGELTTTTGGGNITSLTFTNCSSPNCTGVSASAPRTGKSFPWASTATPLPVTNGQLHVTGPSGKFTATCFFITATCEYETSSATVEVTNSTSTTKPIIHAKAVPLTRVAGAESICGTKADWTAQYTVSSPATLTIL